MAAGLGISARPGAGLYGFRFDLPAQCADALGAGRWTWGWCRAPNWTGWAWDFLPGLGIACEGPVRSILLISKMPIGEIRTLAADSGSRTSVALAQDSAGGAVRLPAGDYTACASARRDAGGV